MNFKKFEKVTLNNGERDYIFYASKSFRSIENLTIWVDENDNILNVFSGKYPKIYKDILFVLPDTQDGAYINLKTGEEILTEYTKKYGDYRCFTPFNFGYASAFNGKTNMIDVFNIEGEIVKSYKSFHMLNENRGIISQRYLDNNLSMIDGDLNIISENCFSEIIDHNDKYIIANIESNKKVLHYIFDFNGNKLSKGYKKLNTKDFIAFKVSSKETSNKVMQLNLEEILNSAS
jgi:hypothetical protein